LLKILEEDGFDKRELNEFIEQEIRNGYLRRLRIAYIGIRLYLFPRYIPSYWFHQLKILDQDENEALKQKCRDLELHEENYLLAQYSPELANPAKRSKLLSMLPPPSPGKKALIKINEVYFASYNLPNQPATKEA
jgi:hypothetical protein